MTDVIIVGLGPAGISAALYTIRAGVSTILIGRDTGALEKAEHIENFYGHATPLTGAALAEAGISQVKQLGAEIITGEVVGLRLDDFYTVETTDGSYEARAVILATGAARVNAEINGLDAFENKGVSYCAVCDAFFYRGREVAVLGNGLYALHEALELLPVTGPVTVLTNGKPAVAAFPSDIRVVVEKITGLTGGERLEGVSFENGEALAVSGLFIALGVAGSTELAKKIGAVTMDNRIVTDAFMRTSVPGLWAAGDCTGGMKQIAKAVYEGALAGTDAVKYIREARA